MSDTARAGLTATNRQPDPPGGGKGQHGDRPASRPWQWSRFTSGQGRADADCERCSVFGTQLQITDINRIDWVRVLIGELLVGLVIGLVTNLVFEAAQTAGQVVGFQLGFTLETAIDPQTNADTPIMSLFHQSIAILIFLQLNIHHWILRALAASFDYIPPGSMHPTVALATGMMRVVGAMLVTALQIAAPLLVATMLIDVALGFIGRASPSLPVVFIGISLKDVVGFLILSHVVILWPTLFEGQFRRALDTLDHLLHLAR